MIGYLKGQPKILGDQLLIVVSGVGYTVQVPARLLTEFAVMTEVELYIYTHVREDALELFGFNSPQDKQMFELLLSVSGVGPKTALGIMEYGTQTISEAVQDANVSVFSSVPRVGKKLAQKIIIDLKTKLGSVRELNLGPSSAQEQEVTQALEALGFSSTDIYKAVQGLDMSGSSATGDLLKQAMKNLTNHA